MPLLLFSLILCQQPEPSNPPTYDRFVQAKANVKRLRDREKEQQQIMERLTREMREQQRLLDKATKEREAGETELASIREQLSQEAKRVQEALLADGDKTKSKPPLEAMLALERPKRQEPEPELKEEVVRPSKEFKGGPEKGNLIIVIPEQATLTLDGEAMKGTKAKREYTMDLGEEGHIYTIIVTWEQDGKNQEVTKKAQVLRGKTTEVKIPSGV